MTPKQRAQAWAKEHPEFCGILGVRTRTAKGKYGRLGTKPTTVCCRMKGPTLPVAFD